MLGGLGFVINQRAFQAGSLTASLPTLTVVEPVVAAIVGVTMLHETVPTTGVLEWAAVGSSVIAMIVATVVLSRSAARHDSIHEHELADVLTHVGPRRHESPDAVGGESLSSGRRGGSPRCTRIARTVAQKRPK